jgi:hypothetical protein
MEKPAIVMPCDRHMGTSFIAEGLGDLPLRESLLM